MHGDREKMQQHDQDNRRGLGLVSRSLTVDSILFSLFIFIFLYFSIFRTARVRVDWSRCHISHKLMAKSQD